MSTVTISSLGVSTSSTTSPLTMMNILSRSCCSLGLQQQQIVAYVTTRDAGDYYDYAESDLSNHEIHEEQPFYFKLIWTLIVIISLLLTRSIKTTPKKNLRVILSAPTTHHHPL